MLAASGVVTVTTSPGAAAAGAAVTVGRGIPSR
jgi:hypothetical protein